VDKAGKKEFVATLNSALKDTGSIVVAHYSGLTVAQLQVLRREMKKSGATVKVAKNRLVKIALEGTDVASIGTYLTGPTILAYAEDPVVAPKVAVEFAKKNDKLVILGGAMGNTVLDASGVKALADLPSLDELRAKLLGLIMAPAEKLVRTINEPAAKLVRVMQARVDKEGKAA
jgi:large subunit ribosomal protein L10